MTPERITDPKTVVKHYQMLFQEAFSEGITPEDSEGLYKLMRNPRFQLKMMERHGIVWIEEGDEYIMKKFTGIEKDRLLQDMYKDPEILRILDKIKQ